MEKLNYDDLFELMSSSRRRAAAQVLFEEGPTEFGNLVDRVSEIEYGRPKEEITGDERHTIYVSLQQTHIDSLEDVDIVERERKTGMVTLGPNAGIMAKWITQTNEETGPVNMDLNTSSPDEEVEELIENSITKHEVKQLFGNWKDSYSEGFSDGYQKAIEEKGNDLL